MRAGRLDQRVTIHEKSVTRDAMGGEVIAWQERLTCWAEVAPVSGKQFFAAGQEQQRTDARITIRYAEGITPAMRVEHRNEFYDIQAVINPRSARTELQLMCARGVRDDGR